MISRHTKSERSATPVSMRDWFGPYSNDRFLTVWWVVTALASRYQGNFVSHMGDLLYHTAFHCVDLGDRPLAHPAGEIWFKKNFLSNNKGEYNDREIYRARSLCHEMMHYLVRSYAGGRPRDVYNPACTHDGDHKCYSDDNSLALAKTEDWETVKNVDNYRGWLFNRYLRWCGDWPPELDVPGSTVYTPDPIDDDKLDELLTGGEWSNPWTPLLTLRDEMKDSSWKPFI